MSKKFLILAALLLLATTGCVIQFGSGQNGSGIKGVFKSVDKGNNWQVKNLFLFSGGAGNINGVDVTDFIFDPQDYQAIYLTTVATGLLYSYDGGESWLRAQGLDGQIGAAVVDPKNKCVIYVARNNTVVKSVDCTRSWSEVYIDSRADKTITALGVDHFDDSIIYAGNNAGDILKSVNGGGEWRVVNRLNDRVAKILIDTNDSRIIYIATKTKGIFKTTDGGQSWGEINEGLKSYPNALDYRNLIFDLSQPNSLLLVSKYGLIKTADGGSTWQALNLITPPSTTEIAAVAISPINNQEIYYATASTFYKTTDGGKNWVTKRLPSNAPPSVLVVNPNNPSVIYMGFSAPVKK